MSAAVGFTEHQFLGIPDNKSKGGLHLECSRPKVSRVVKEDMLLAVVNVYHLANTWVMANHACANNLVYQVWSRMELN